MAVLNRLCTPAFLYAAVHILLLAVTFLRYLSKGILFRSEALSSLILNIVFVAAWAFILNYMCSKGLGPISWLLVLAPFIAMLGLSRRQVNLFDVNPLAAFM